MVWSGRMTNADGKPVKLVALEAELARLGPVFVSFSGGVDSSLLAVVARRVLGDDMACGLLDSPLIPRAEVAEAGAIAAAYGLPLAVLSFDPLSDPAVAGNSVDRCYHCKRAAHAVLRREATKQGIATVVDGVNCSDLGEHRPGLSASDKAGIRHPFVAAGIAKEDVRAIARALGLPFAEKPSAACLASRVPYGEELTPATLARVEAGEAALHDLGFLACRVRAHGRLARIEVPVADLGRAFASAGSLVAALKATGFAYVALDLEGYRTGAMDESRAGPR